MEPFSELGRISRLGFVPIPAAGLAALGAIVVASVGATELAKAWFYRSART